jgi:hypothetical protein
MVSCATMRRMALALPETDEGEHHGHPDFRVRGKIFATLRPDERRAVLRLGRLEQAALVKAAPMTFAKAWGATGWTSVELDSVESPEFRDLLTGAWRGVAPKRLAASYDGTE